MKEYNYLKLLKKLGECIQGDERQCLQAVYTQLKDLTEEKIKNDRSSWSKLRVYYALYVDPTKLERVLKKREDGLHTQKRKYSLLSFEECYRGLQKYLEAQQKGVVV
ncbi:hypothetical protein E0L10_14340 [Enterococcus durans]|uniref:hypothetical protein n=1 Tax=Enterococcus durans TaxID=53345 RepID=UPI001431D77D|nr:hypothetical protein [Enterococcus durans]NJE65234.1 hypothetical protein [Enterococcus durans]